MSSDREAGSSADADAGSGSDSGPGPDSDPGFVARLYRQFPALLMARRNLARNRLRSALAALGIIIGVLAIASLGMFGTTLQVGATQQLGGIGNELTVSPNPEAGVQNLTDRDVQSMRRVVHEGTVVPVRNGNAVVSRGRERTVVTLYGMENPDALYETREGRIPDELRQGALVGSSLADRLDVEPGNSITVGNSTYRVRAVLEESTGISLVNPNDAVILPLDDVGQKSGYPQVVVTAPSGEAANESAMAIREELNQREQRVTIFELSSITQQINQFFGIINVFLIGIGSISLVVAGVSILNVMLMSTVERRQEIGVLRAVGVQKLDVVRMILAEAALLGLIGGVLGAVLALFAGLVLNQIVLGDPMVTFRSRNLLFLALAVVFGLIASLLSGVYPAWKAANERPVDALRK